MTLFKKGRLLFWLLKAYIKKSYKMLVIWFLIGLSFFLLLIFNGKKLMNKLPIRQEKTIGVVGEYTLDTLPSEILQKLSRGLTKLDSSGQPLLDVARDYRIRDDGKTYDFLIHRNTTFSDGSALTSADINPGFTDVSIARPIPQRIIFTLKDQYAPFMVTMTKPIFKNDFVGLGDYTLSDIHLNGTFVESMTITSRSEAKDTIQYLFYPTVEAVKTAFVLGEAGQVDNLPDLSFDHTSFERFPNVLTKKVTDYQNLVTLFYNTKDKDIGNIRLREAFSYAIPNNFSQGQRNYTPYAPSSWVSKNTQFGNEEDLEHAKILLTPIFADSKVTTLHFTLKTLPEYESAAKKIANEWKKVGIILKVQSVDTIPADYQLFLGKFTLPKDPDQYTLWHSNQRNNITGYDNKRIDKLLEDGRKTVDSETRRKIYVDFQKYLLEDPPASFLFFPYTYSITRK